MPASPPLLAAPVAGRVAAAGSLRPHHPAEPGGRLPGRVGPRHRLAGLPVRVALYKSVCTGWLLPAPAQASSLHTPSSPYTRVSGHPAHSPVFRTDPPARPPTPRRSPWSAGKAVATPEQLKQYFDMFASPAAARQQAAAPASPADAAYQQAAAAAAAAGRGRYDQGDGVGSPLLPLGRDAPLYRPSIVSGPRQAGRGDGGALCCAAARTFLGARGGYLWTCDLRLLAPGCLAPRLAATLCRRGPWSLL
jgi:hypothetical protein